MFSVSSTRLYSVHWPYYYQSLTSCEGLLLLCKMMMKHIITRICQIKRVIYFLLDIKSNRTKIIVEGIGDLLRLSNICTSLTNHLRSFHIFLIQLDYRLYNF